MSIKDSFKFECGCGSRTFHLIRKTNPSSKLYFMCEGCKDICGSVDVYSINWLREDSDYGEED